MVTSFLPKQTFLLSSVLSVVRQVWNLIPINCNESWVVFAGRLTTSNIFVGKKTVLFIQAFTTMNDSKSI